jgi:peptide chain release factor 3
MSDLDSRSEILRRRTFAIISHPDAGKTTLTEKLIYQGGLIREAGEVKGKAGTKGAKSDWMALERQRGISITSSVMQFDYRGLRINLLDTPGHKDFSEDTYRTLIAADSVCMLIDVAKGVEERTKKLYEVCRFRKMPVITFVNKLDREGKSPLELVDEIETTLGMSCYPVTWPVGIGARFMGVYHRLRNQLIIYDQRREDDLSFEVHDMEGYKDHRMKELIPEDIYEQVIEDLDLLDVALGDLDKGSFLASEISPVIFGSAKQNFGVDIFLDLFADIAPPPGPRKAVERVLDPLANEFTAFVFKIQANMDKRHRDRVAFLRVVSGVFERGMKVNHSRLGKEIRLAHSNQFVAEDRETVDVAYAGDIIGVNDSGNFQIGDTVTTGKKVAFADIPRFSPELFARVSVTDAMKRKKLQKGIAELAEEGMIQLFVDPLVGLQDPIIGVVGELQFEVLLYRLQDEYGLEARLMRLPFGVARWPRNKMGVGLEKLNGAFTLYRDMNDQPVLLLNQEWDLNWA